MIFYFRKVFIARPLTLNNTDYKRNKGCRKEGQISLDVMGDPCTKTRKCDPSESNGNYLYNSMIGI